MSEYTSVNRQLIELGLQKQNLMEQYVLLCRIQGEIIERGSLEELDKHLAEKQAVIEQVNEIDSRLNPLMERLEREMPPLDPGEGREQWTEIQEKTSRLASRAKEIDDENMKKMQDLKNQLAARLKSVRQGKKSLGLYTGKQVHMEGIFLDKRK